MGKTCLAVAGLLCALALGAGAFGDGGEAWLASVAQQEAAIGRLEAEKGPFAAGLAQPLTALAELLLAEGMLPEAADSLRRAQHVIHRNEGVHSPAQLDAVRLLTRIALAQQDWRAANKQQEFIFFTLRRHYGEEAPETLAAYREMAGWYLRTGQPRRASRLLTEAAEHATHRDTRLALASLAEKARRLQGACCKVRRLEEALAMSEGQAGDPDALAELHLTLADSLLLARRPEDAQAHYALAAGLSPASANAEARPISLRRHLDQGKPDVIMLRPTRTPLGTRLERLTPREQLEAHYQPPRWFIIDGAEDGLGEHLAFRAKDLRDASLPDPKRQQLVGHPILFSAAQFEHLLPSTARSPEALAELRVELAFTVTAAGRLENVQVIDSNAPKRLDWLLSDALRRSSFRPKLLNGQPQREDDVRLVQTFAPREVHL